MIQPLTRRGLPPAQVQQVLDNHGLDLKTVSAGPGGLVYEQFGSLHLYDPRRARHFSGTRTWGGLVGISGYPTLIDGGTVTAPRYAIYGLEGEWEVEGNGIPPHVIVEELPKDAAAGHDAQLERAVQIVMQQLKEHPVPVSTLPAYPDFQGHRYRPLTSAGKGAFSPLSFLISVRTNAAALSLIVRGARQYSRSIDWTRAEFSAAT